MDFSGCNVRIVDAVMGAGKSQSIINLINNSGKVEQSVQWTVAKYTSMTRIKRIKNPKSVICHKTFLMI